jgi:hypothetical protein
MNLAIVEDMAGGAIVREVRLLVMDLTFYAFLSPHFCFGFALQTISIENLVSATHFL